MNHYIRYPMRGPDVQSVQVLVNEMVALDTPLVEDGIFGAMTLEGVKKLQARVNASVDGVVGPETLYKSFDTIWAEHQTTKPGDDPSPPPAAIVRTGQAVTNQSFSFTARPIAAFSFGKF